MSLWLWCLGLTIGLSLKNLHFMWHVRCFSALAIGYLARRKSNCALKHHDIFIPAVFNSRSPPSECDFNLHKSNSTYITDLDVSRAYLSGFLFAPILLNYKHPIHCNLIVSAITCVFHREIKPYQPYEVWTKVGSWDDKWIYMVSHFVTCDKYLPKHYGTKEHVSNNSREFERPRPPHDERYKDVFASAVTRMVFKKGRLTIPPQRALEICGILSSESESPTASSPTANKVERTESDIDYPEWTLEEIEFSRRANLPLVRLERGWDAVRKLFRQERFALTEYNEFMW